MTGQTSVRLLLSVLVALALAACSPATAPPLADYRKLGELIKSCGWFDIEERSNPADPGKQIYIRKRSNR